MTPAAILHPVTTAVAVAATAFTIASVSASDYVETEALFHARAIEDAWNTLANHVTAESTAAVSWVGTTPPASTGWLPDWTARGLGALYCDSMLLVHVVTDTMKGVGTNLPAVHMAPHLEAKQRNRDVAPLHWLDGGTADGILGRESVALPACMGTTPSARPAIAGPAIDPFTVTTNQVTQEHQQRACPAGFHGQDQTWTRDVTQELNGRGDPTGSPTTGPWSLLIDPCTADTVSWEHYHEACTFTPGEPHTGTLTGEVVWRREKSVTAQGTSYGAPEFVSTSCWTDPSPTPPTPTEWTSTTTERRTVSCGTGYTGSRTQTRTITWRHLRWPWDGAATVQRTSQTNWTTTASNCTANNSGGNGGGGNGGGGNVGGGWDVDGDGRADVADLSDVAEGDRPNANYVQGHTPTGGNGGNNGGNDNDPGSNCGGCGRPGF